jgi:hypothetical protein
VDENYSDSYDTENAQMQNEESSTEPIEDENINPEIEADSSYEAENDESTPSDEVIEGLLGLGAPTPNEQEIYKHLIATRDLLRANPKLIPPHIDHTKGFLSMLDYSIKHFWTPERNKAMRILALNEAKINKISGISEDDLLGADDDDLDGIVDYDDVYEFNGLGDLGGKEKRKQVKAERKAEKKAQKEKNKAERKQAKGFFRKIGVSLKQGTKTFKKFNPALIAMRNGFLLAMKINLFGLAAKAKWGYATPEQAKAAGISDEKYQKSKKFVAQLEKIFADRSGGSKVSLKRNILTAKKSQLKGYDTELSGPEAAPIIAAIPLITAVVKMLKDSGLLSKKEADDINSKAESGKIDISAEDAKEFNSILSEDALEDKKNSDAGGSDNSKGEGDGIFNKAWGFAKEHPILTIGGLVVAAYFFVEPFKNAVNGMLKIGVKPKASTQQALSGIGNANSTKKISTSKPSEAPPKKLELITLK